MNALPEAEPLNQEGFVAFSERAGEEEPVVMLNLLRFKPDGGRERYAEYGAAVAPLLDKAARSATCARRLWRGASCTR